MSFISELSLKEKTEKREIHLKLKKIPSLVFMLTGTSSKQATI